MKKLVIVFMTIFAGLLSASAITQAEFKALVASKTTVAELQQIYTQSKATSDNLGRRAAMFIYPRLIELGEYQAAATLAKAEIHFKGYCKAMVKLGKRKEAYELLKGVSEDTAKPLRIRRLSALYASRLVWKNRNLITKDMVTLMSQIPKNEGFSNGEKIQSVRTISMACRDHFTDKQITAYFSDLETNYKPASFPSQEMADTWANHVTANAQ